MRRIIFAPNITLDGYYDHTAGIADDELHEKAAELIRSSDVIIFGRIMYQLMEDYWPKAITNKSIPMSLRSFAQAINEIKKIVISTTLTKVDWNTTIIRQITPEDIQAMKLESGKDILLGGGAKTAKIFIENNLIDDYRFIIHPVLFGKGKRLFENISFTKLLKLEKVEKRKSGVVELVYIPSDEK